MFSRLTPYTERFGRDRTGDADYHLKIVCRDLDAYNHLLETFLFRLPGIAHVKTNVVLKEIKSRSFIPV